MDLRVSSLIREPVETTDLRVSSLVSETMEPRASPQTRGATMELAEPWSRASAPRFKSNALGYLPDRQTLPFFFIITLKTRVE